MALNVARVHAWEALDSRGTPTVACSVTLTDGAEGQATVPSGASTGSHEAHERRDGGVRYGGRGVLGAVGAVNDEIAVCVRGLDVENQELVDTRLRELDGTDDLRRLGANAVLAVSVACARATAAAQRKPLWRVVAPDGPPLLPLPMVNVISGGAHAGGLIDLQDVLVVPIGASCFGEAIEWAARVRAGTAAVLRGRGYATGLVADEGGLAAPLGSNREALEVVVAGITNVGLAPGRDIALAIDVAATQLAEVNVYRLARDSRTVSAAELVGEIRTWCDAFPIVSLEDPVGEDDDDGWKLASAAFHDVQLLGDDLFVTSLARLEAGIRDGIANAVLVKPNQVGTLSDARRVIERAHSAGYATVLSARSGDTEEAWLADLAVGWAVGQLKVGSTTRSERTAKWNRLLRIEAEHPDAVFAGRGALAAFRT